MGNQLIQCLCAFEKKIPISVDLKHIYKLEKYEGAPALVTVIEANPKLSKKIVHWETNVLVDSELWKLYSRYFRPP